MKCEMLVRKCWPNELPEPGDNTAAAVGRAHKSTDCSGGWGTAD